MISRPNWRVPRSNAFSGAWVARRVAMWPSMVARPVRTTTATPLPLTTDAWERVIAQSQQAVRELALGLGVLQTRLEGACDALLSLEPRELPEPVRPEFLALIATILDIEDLDG